MEKLSYILLFATSLLASSFLCPLFIVVGKKFGVVDYAVSDSPKRKKFHKTPIPLMGGVAIFLSFILSLLLWAPGFASWSLLLSLGSFFILGLLDDVYNLSAKLRIVMQFSICFLFIYNLGIEPFHIKLIPGVDLSLSLWASYIFGTLILVGAINSLNMIDGLDGLAAGVIFISVFLLSFVHFFITREYAIFLLTLPVIGALVGFLRYNVYPARIFLGDGGSNWLGFLCGVLFLLPIGGFSIGGQN